MSKYLKKSTFFESSPKNRKKEFFQKKLVLINSFRLELHFSYSNALKSTQKSTQELSKQLQSTQRWYKAPKSTESTRKDWEHGVPPALRDVFWFPWRTRLGGCETPTRSITAGFSFFLSSILCWTTHLKYGIIHQNAKFYIIDMGFSTWTCKIKFPKKLSTQHG